MALPPEAAFEDVKIRIRQSIRNPNVGSVDQVVLKEGPKAFRLATLYQILDPESKKTHHYSLKIDSIDRKKAGWFHKPEKSVSLEGGDSSEIERLFLLLRAHFEGKLSVATDDLHLITSADYSKLERLLDLVPNLSSPDLVQLVGAIVPKIKDAGEYLPDLIQAFNQSDSSILSHIATAATLVKYRKALCELRERVSESHATEKDFQDILKLNPWMFGSEYSELLDRRTWTRDDNLDFMLRRTADNYLEIVEIKTPFNEPLFNYDKSHDCYYASSKLSAVVGQVMRYIEEVERSRDYISNRDGHDPLKIRARVIVGKDKDDKHQAALRNFNAHLNRIEIITFDQLVRISERAIGIFEVQSTEQIAEEHDEIPW